MFNSVLNWISEYFQWNDSLRKFSLTLLKSLPVACALLPLSSSAAIKCSRNSQMLNISTRTGTIIFSNKLIISFKLSASLMSMLYLAAKLSGSTNQDYNQSPGTSTSGCTTCSTRCPLPPNTLRGRKGKKVLTCRGRRICCWLCWVHFWSLTSKQNKKNTLDWAGMIRGVTALMSHQDAYPQKCQHLTGCR